MRAKLDEMVGETITGVTGLNQYSESVMIHCASGKVFEFYHEHDCCESVQLEDFDGEADDLLGGLITEAAEHSNDIIDTPEVDAESYTWTFYRLETNKGGLWMRWLGESNGYYSESAAFRKVQ